MDEENLSGGEEFKEENEGGDEYQDEDAEVESDISSDQGRSSDSDASEVQTRLLSS